MKWEKVHTKGDVPPGVAAHSAVVFKSKIFVLGGLTEDGASNLMYRFNTEDNIWTKLKFEGDLPACRLDYSMCLVPWTVSEENEDGQQVTRTLHLAFAFGGMDTRGVIYNDCVVTVIT